MNIDIVLKERYDVNVLEILGKDGIPDGYTETVEDTPENLDKILKIVKECGLK